MEALKSLPLPDKNKNPEIKCPKCGAPVVWKPFKTWWGEVKELPCVTCDCKTKIERDEWLESRCRVSGIPKGFWGENLSDWVQIPGTERMVEIAKPYAKNVREYVEDKGVGCLFAGAGVGTGKSKCLYYIQNAAIKAGISTYAITCKKFMAKLRILNARRQYEALGDYIKKIIRIPFLIYDDLAEQEPDRWVKAEAESIIVEREIYNRATLFSSNQDEEGIAASMGKHLASRIIKMATPWIAVNKSDIDMRRPENRKKYGLKIR